MSNLFKTGPLFKATPTRPSETGVRYATPRTVIDRPGMRDPIPQYPETVGTAQTLDELRNDRLADDAMGVRHVARPRYGRSM